MLNVYFLNYFAFIDYLLLWKACEITHLTIPEFYTGGTILHTNIFYFHLKAVSCLEQLNSRQCLYESVRRKIASLFWTGNTFTQIFCIFLWNDTKWRGLFIDLRRFVTVWLLFFPSSWLQGWKRFFLFSDNFFFNIRNLNYFHLQVIETTKDHFDVKFAKIFTDLLSFCRQCNIFSLI